MQFNSMSLIKASINEIENTLTCTVQKELHKMATKALGAPFLKLKLNLKSSIFNQVSIEKFKLMKIPENMELALYRDPILVTTAKERLRLIKTFHDTKLIGAHAGSHRVYNKMKHLFFWPKMRKQISLYCKKCVPCQLNKAHAMPKQPMVITNRAQRAFDHVQCDTVGPLETWNGYRYILTIQCVLTKFVVLAPMSTKSAEETAKVMFNDFVFVHGFPKVLQTDNGTEFANAVVSEITAISEIKHSFSTPYRPQTLGAMERNHRVLNDYLRSFSTPNNNWAQSLKFYQFSWNTTPNHEINDFSPYQLVYGREANLPLFVFEKLQPVYNFDNYAKELKFRIQTAQNLASKCLEKAKETRKLAYDSNARPIELKIGDLVKVTNEGRSKFDPFYQGPFTVTEISNPNVTLRKSDDTLFTVHLNRVAKFHT